MSNEAAIWFLTLWQFLTLLAVCLLYGHLVGRLQRTARHLEAMQFELDDLRRFEPGYRR